MAYSAFRTAVAHETSLRASGVPTVSSLAKGLATQVLRAMSVGASGLDSQTNLARVLLSAARPHFGPILHQPDCQCQQGTSLNLGITKAKVSSAAWHSAASSARSRERKRGRRAADWWWTLACKPTSWILARCVFKLLRSPKRRAHATKTTLRAYLQMTCSARRSCQKYLLWRLASIMCRRASKPPYLVIRGFRLPWQPWHWISRPIERFKAAST